MKVREETHNLKSYSPIGDIALLRPNTFYLESVDEKYRRFYGCVKSTSNLLQPAVYESPR